MISNISPSVVTIDETINTLVYSNRAKNIQTIVRKNVVSSMEHISQVNKYDEIISNLSSKLEELRHELAVKTHNKHLLQKREISMPNIFIGQAKMEKLSKDINKHFNEEKKQKVDILEIKRILSNLKNEIKNKEYLLYKFLNQPEMKKSSSASNILRQNYLTKNQRNSSLKVRELRFQIEKMNKKLLLQKDILKTKENIYNELVKKREILENSIGKLGGKNGDFKNYTALQYLYKSYILEINNLENEYMRKESLNEIKSKEIKIQKLVEQLKIRDEYINKEKSQLARKNLNYYFDGEKDIKQIEELNLDKNYNAPQSYRNLFSKMPHSNNVSFNLTKNMISRNNNKVNQLGINRYDYSGYCNPNIIKEKKVIKTKTNEIMKKSKNIPLSQLKLNILNEQYKNSKVFYVNKDTNPNMSYSEEHNVISFDTRKINKSNSSGNVSNISQNNSLNASHSNQIYNYREREIDNKIKKLMVFKKRGSPYIKW